MRTTDSFYGSSYHLLNSIQTHSSTSRTVDNVPFLMRTPSVYNDPDNALSWAVHFESVDEILVLSWAWRVEFLQMLLKVLCNNVLDKNIPEKDVYMAILTFEGDFDWVMMMAVDLSRKDLEDGKLLYIQWHLTDYVVQYSQPGSNLCLQYEQRGDYPGNALTMDSSWLLLWNR